jgi:hypothetical protein
MAGLSWVRGLAVAAGLASGATAQAAESWQWTWPVGQHQRFYLENEVLLPLMMWFQSDYNHQARMTAWQTKAILDCESVIETKKAYELRCRVEDFSLKAAALPADIGLVTPIVAEMDEKISGASLQIILRKDGRITHIDLEEINIRNRRISAMRENLRLVMARMVYGLDLKLPRADRVGEVWDQSDAMLFTAPSPRGTLGSADTVHRATVGADGRARIETAGRGMVIPNLDKTMNLYDTELQADGVFDPAKGRLVRRSWTLKGEPTASSSISENGAGVPYIQRGRLVYLEDGVASPPVGESIEMSAPGTSVTTLQQWESLGMPYAGK